MKDHSDRSINWTKRLLALGLLLLLLGVGLSPAQAFLRIQPQLMLMAANQPEQMIKVIVQKQTQSRAVEELVARLGGVITKDLYIINAFAAEMPAGKIPVLANETAVRYVSFDAPVEGSASHSKFTAWATKAGTIAAMGFSNSANMMSPVGPNGTYGSGSQVKGAFSGFNAEYTPGTAITKVEVAMRLYTAEALATTETPKFTPYVNGAAGATVAMAVTQINNHVGVSAAGKEYLDITNTRVWKWSDFNTLEIMIDQTALSSKSTLYYDAVGVRITTAAGSDATTPLTMQSSADDSPVNTSVLANVFNRAVRATDIWNEAPYTQGGGVTVAVVDSGSFKTNGIGTRLIGEVNFNSTEHNANDRYGHGTFVVGLIADDGSFSGGKYMGMAPKANIMGLRVSDDNGMSSESDVVDALQWVYNNKATYNIKVVNLSMNSSMMQSYHTSPLAAVCEILWFNQIVVVVSAGNNGTANLYPPANDPFVITVGAVDDKNTVSLADDTIATFSAWGADEAGKVKPELVAPGKNLIAYLPENNTLTISTQHPEKRVDSNYFRMSGTSMSAPLVSGAAALLLQDEPSLTPDQVKYRLMATANKTWAGYDAAKAGAGYLDVYAAVKGTTTASANTGVAVSNLLNTGSSGVNMIWGSVNWSSVNWSSVNWSSVNWSSVNWSSVNWASDYWGN